MYGQRIENQAAILAVLNQWLDATKRTKDFIGNMFLKRGTVWNGHVQKGGLFVEASRPLTITPDQLNEGETVIVLTNGNSRYIQPIGTIKLSDIGYIELD